MTEFGLAMFATSNALLFAIVIGLVPDRLNAATQCGAHTEAAYEQATNASANFPKRCHTSFAAHPRGRCHQSERAVVHYTGRDSLELSEWNEVIHPRTFTEC